MAFSFLVMFSSATKVALLVMEISFFVSSLYASICFRVDASLSYSLWLSFTESSLILVSFAMASQRTLVDFSSSSALTLASATACRSSDTFSKFICSLASCCCCP